MARREARYGVSILRSPEGVGHRMVTAGLPNGCLLQIAAHGFSTPQGIIAIPRQGLDRDALLGATEQDPEGGFVGTRASHVPLPAKGPGDQPDTPDGCFGQKRRALNALANTRCRIIPMTQGIRLDKSLARDESNYPVPQHCVQNFCGSLAASGKPPTLPAQKAGDQPTRAKNHR